VRIERKVGATIAVLGSLLLAVSGTAPAFAHTGHSAGLRFGGLRLADTLAATSTGFGGWVFGAKKATSVTAEFKGTNAQVHGHYEWCGAVGCPAHR